VQLLMSLSRHLSSALPRGLLTQYVIQHITSDVALRSSAVVETVCRSLEPLTRISN
jgi:hypothetical protein